MESSVAIGMVFKLMRGKRLTAKELGDDFEVSSRTIYRYVDCLSASGVPIVCISGKNGGLEIDKNFVINDSFLTLEEVQYLLKILKIQEKTPKNQVLIEKINKIYQILWKKHKKLKMQNFFILHFFWLDQLFFWFR